MRMNDSFWMSFLATRVISSEGDCSFQGKLFVLPRDTRAVLHGCELTGKPLFGILPSKICFQHPSLYIPGVVYFPALTLLTKSAKMQGCDLTVNQDRSVIFNIRAV